MVEAMCEFVFQSTHFVVQNAPFISVSCDEVTIIDNQSWISTHLYVVEGWRCLLIILTLQ
jgi:hypothetical protein